VLAPSLAPPVPPPPHTHTHAHTNTRSLFSFWHSSRSFSLTSLWQVSVRLLVHVMGRGLRQPCARAGLGVFAAARSLQAFSCRKHTPVPPPSQTTTVYGNNSEWTTAELLAHPQGRAAVALECVLMIMMFGQVNGWCGWATAHSFES
jgi:hypothetical protein